MPHTITRYFGLTLSALMCLSWLSVDPSRLAAAEPDKLLPAETEIVFQINYKQILESDLIKKYALEQMKQALQDQSAKKLLDELGLDPFRDIHRIIIAGEIKGADDSRYLMIAYGNFDPEKLFATAEAYSKKNTDNFAMIREQETVMFKFQPNNGQLPVYATVLDDKTVIAGSDKKIIMNAVNASRSDKNKPPIKPELAALIKKMDDKASMYACAWVKGKFDDVNIPQGAPIDLTKFQDLIPKMETMSLMLRVGKDIQMEVGIGMNNQDAADEMSKAVKNLLNDVKPLLQLATAADPRTKPLTDVVNSIKVNGKNKEVTLTGEISEANIQRMIKPQEDE
jgi:hypothetical protein